MSELSKNVYSKYPFIVKAKARGYYDYKSTQVITNSSNIPIEMNKFDDIESTFKETENYPLTIKTKGHTLPNWNFVNDTYSVLMPIGKTYKDIGQFVQNYYLINSGCTVDENGIYSGFSSDNKLTFNKVFPLAVSSMDLTTKAQFTENGSHSTLFGRNSAGDGTIIIRSENSTFKFGYYNSGWIWESTAPEVELNKWYWFKVTWDGTNLTGYMLEDNSYTLDTLPEVASWTQCWQSTSNIFPGNSFDIGYNKNSTYEYCHGSIDMTNTKFVVNDKVFLEYNQKTLLKDNLPGCLYNYNDTGSADTLSMYSVEKAGEETYLILTKDDLPIIDDHIVTYLNDVQIPAHTVYNYSEVDGYKSFDVSLVGTDAVYDDSTYEFVGSKNSESYLKLNYNLKDTDNLTVLIKVKFSDVSAAAVIGSKPNSWWIGASGGKIGGWLGGGFSCDFTLESEKTYWIKVVEDSVNLKVYAIEDNNYLVNDLNFGESVYTRERFGLTKYEFVFGANVGYSNENCDGTFYLRDSKLLINDNPIFGSIPIGQWTVK